MYLLDTNVVAELRKAKAGKANKRVTAWANSVAPASLFLSTITVLEMELGVLLMERRDVSQGAILRAWLRSGACRLRMSRVRRRLGAHA